MAEAAKQNQKFEIRHYEAVRQEHLARSLGRISIDSARQQELAELRERRRVEIIDILSEGLKLEKENTPRAAISTHREFELRGGKLLAQDGEVIEELLKRALREDIKLASQDNFFAPFLPARTRHELDEHRDNEATARGETGYNTTITFSPYTEELDDGSAEKQAKLIEAAQKPYYKRAMIRLSHWDGQKLHMFTRSIDNSSVDLLQETARRELAYEFKAKNSTEMLGERLRLTINDDSWQELIDKIVNQADSVLAEQNGGRWKQGIKQKSYREALAYVSSQSSVVDGIIKIGEDMTAQHDNFEDYNAAFKEKLYDALALLEKRLESGRENEAIENYDAASSGAGAIARGEGRSYDACGLIIRSAENNAENVGKQTGFESLLRLEGRPISCPNCEKKVVVDKKYLGKGELYCKDCGYHVDVCTGKSVLRKNPEYLTSQVISGFEMLARYIKKLNIEARIKKTLKKQAQPQTEFESKLLAKSLRQEQEELYKLAA